jgi:hypothetical protein
MYIIVSSFHYYERDSQENGLQGGKVGPKLVLAVETHDGHGRPHLLVVHSGDSAAPQLLQQNDNAWDHAGPLLLKRKQRPGRADEDFGVAVFNVLSKALLVHQHADAIAVRAASVVGPSVLADHLVAPQKQVVTLPVGESSTSHAHVLQQA